MRKIFLLLSLAALIFGGWYFASPWLAMKGIVDAAEARDSAALEERIDFERLRTETSTRLQSEIAEATQDGGLLGQIGGAIAGQLADGVVDTALTPRGITNLVTAGAVTVPLVPERFRGQELQWDVARTGLSAFDAVSTWEDGSSGPVLNFERDGIGWQLVGVELAEW